MTHPNPKDPQAELREAILKEVAFTHGSKPADVHPDSLISQVVDDILALFQAHQQQLLSELLEAKKLYITELAWKHAASEEAVPVSVIQSKIGELNG